MNFFFAFIKVSMSPLLPSTIIVISGDASIARLVAFELERDFARPTACFPPFGQW